MIRFINHTTGSLMWVHESRAEEYRKLGDIPAEELPLPEPPPEEPGPEKAEAPAPEPAQKPERKSARRTAKSEEW